MSLPVSDVKMAIMYFRIGLYKDSQYSFRSGWEFPVRSLNDSLTSSNAATISEFDEILWWWLWPWLCWPPSSCEWKSSWELGTFSRGTRKLGMSSDRFLLSALLFSGFRAVQVQSLEAAGGDGATFNDDPFSCLMLNTLLFSSIKKPDTLSSDTASSTMEVSPSSGMRTWWVGIAGKRYPLISLINNQSSAIALVSRSKM